MIKDIYNVLLNITYPIMYIVFYKKHCAKYVGLSCLKFTLIRIFIFFSPWKRFSDIS